LAGTVPVDAAAGTDTKADEVTQRDKPLEALFEEYIQVQSQHLDMPSVLTQLSGFYQARGDTGAALLLLQSALKKNPEASTARVNLADLYRALGRESDARNILEAGIALREDDAALWFSLALLEVRESNGERALNALERASSLEEAPGYYHYVYAVALHDQGQLKEALATLRAIHREAPGQANVLAALAQYSQQAGEMQSARRYRDELQATLQAAGLR
jgi:tetratricopeptide (TPR) repeat protein